MAIKTNKKLLFDICNHETFISGNYDINFLKKHPLHEQKNSGNGAAHELQAIAALAAGVAAFEKRRLGGESDRANRIRGRNLNGWKMPSDSWRLSGLRKQMES